MPTNKPRKNIGQLLRDRKERDAKAAKKEAAAPTEKTPDKKPA